MSTNIPVTATALSIDLAGASGKMYRLNISAPSSGFSLSLQEINGVGAAVDLTSLGGDHVGSSENPVTLDTSNEIESEFESKSSAYSCQSDASKSIKSNASKNVKSNASKSSKCGGKSKDDSCDSLDSFDSTFSMGKVVAAKKSAKKKAPVKPAAVGKGRVTTTAAGTRHSTRRCLAEPDSDDDFDEAVGFSQEIF